jgi:hypothetical protein
VFELTCLIGMMEVFERCIDFESEYTYCKSRMLIQDIDVRYEYRVFTSHHDIHMPES